MYMTKSCLPTLYIEPPQTTPIFTKPDRPRRHIIGTHAAVWPPPIVRSSVTFRSCTSDLAKKKKFVRCPAHASPTPSARREGERVSTGSRLSPPSSVNLSDLISTFAILLMHAA